jgi:transposase-like protein
MDDTALKFFFSQPSNTYHRQYEALRAIFVEGKSQKEVADHFGFQYNSLRVLVHQFRQQLNDSTSKESPFFETSSSDQPNPIRRK